MWGEVESSSRAYYMFLILYFLPGMGAGLDLKGGTVHGVCGRGEDGLGVVKRDVSFPPRVISRGSSDTGTDRRGEEAEQVAWVGFVVGEKTGWLPLRGVGIRLYVGWDGGGGVTRAVTFFLLETQGSIGSAR